MIIPGYKKSSRGVYYSEEMRNIPECSMDQVFLLGYFKHPSVTEVLTRFGHSLIQLEREGGEGLLEEILLSLPDELKEGLIAGNDRVRQIIAQEISPYSESNYLRIRCGFVPRDYFAQCQGDFFKLYHFIDDLNVCMHGCGEEWSLDLRLREKNLLPYRDIDTLLKHGVEVSNAAIQWWGVNQPDPEVINTGSKRFFVKHLYQSKFNLRSIPNLTPSFLNVLIPEVLFALRNDAQQMQDGEEPDGEEPTDVIVN